MSTRQRTAATSRKDPHGLWRPSDSDSDRPHQTMASSQRHHVDKTAVAEGSRKHRSSRRADPSDPAPVQHHHHKSSSKERTSATQQSSSYGVPQAQQPSSHRTQDVYGDAYSLRAYIKKKTDKRSPRSSNEKFPVNDDPYGSYSGYPSRQDYATAASYAQPPASTNYYTTPADHKSRDPTSSSRHHRERDKDREKSSRRDAERSSTRDRPVETSEERRRRKEKEKEAAREKERSSKDRERRKEKEKSKTRETRTAVDHRQTDAASLYQTYAQPAAPAQRSADRLPSAYPPQTVQATPAAAASAPWAGLTAGGRAASTHTPAPAGESGYPSASDREDPPLPIPPPGHRRDRSDSRTHRSRHQVLAQQAAQDSGISSSEQEQSGMERARRYASRGEQASTLGRGHSSGPSGSENERPPTIQKERRKHRTHGESSRHKSRTTHTDGQQPSGPTSSQEIASAWYQRHVRDGSSSKQAQASGDVPSRPPTTAPHDPVSAQSAMPPTGKPTPYGPSDPHAGTMLPKIPSSTSVARQGELQASDRGYDGTARSQAAAQYYQQSAGRQQDSALPQTTHTPATHESSRAYQQQAYATQSATRGQLAPTQGYPPTASHSRHAEANGVTASAMQGTQPLPDVVVRPPSAAPTYQDPYASRDTAGAAPPHLGVQSGGRLQVPPGDSRSRSTPAPSQPAGYSHATQANVQQASHPHTYGSSQQADASAYRPPTANTSGGAYYGSSHTKAASQDLHSRFPVYEDGTAHVQSTPAAGYGTQHTGVAYPSATQASYSRPSASTTQGQPSASPKRNLTFPGATAPPRPPSVHINPSNYQGAGSYDPRSPKPPSMATITADAPSGRSHAHGAHGRESSGQSTHRPSPRYEQGTQLAADAGQAYATGHSPSRHHLPDPGRSPAAGHAVSAGSVSGTPRHSPSGRLQSHRNGSNDTITHAAPTKPSPSSTHHQQLPAQNASTTNIQAHAATRPDNASASRQPNASSGYPDHVRYRSPAPPGYPTAQPPSTVPNGAGTSHSQSYSTQTPNDYQYGRAPASASAAQTTYTSQYQQPPTQTHARTAQAGEYGNRVQDPPHSAPPTSTAMPVPSQRAPPRTAASPAPTVRPTRLTAVSSPPGKAPMPLQSAPPQPTRHQTYPAPAPPAHSRTVSDPQYAGKADYSTYPSASLGSRAQGQPKAAPGSAPPQPDVLLTPSSLAPSMLPQVTPTVPLDRTTSKTSVKDKDKDKRKGFFGISLFRSRSSPPKPREVEPPPSAAVREKRQRNVSQPSQPLSYMQAPAVGVKSPVAGTAAPQVAVAAAVSIPATSQPQHQPPSQPQTHTYTHAQTHPQAHPQAHSQSQLPPQPQPQPQHQPQHPPPSQYQHRPQHQRGNNSLQVPIAAPRPIAVSGERSPTGKMFTPFRLLSRKHRTVSAASVEAVEGTVINAMLTGGDSTRSSTVGRPSPPLRDPLTAAYEWRNREEYDQQLRGTVRRRRPGVTFDVGEEVPEDGRVPVQKSLKANLEEYEATLVPVQPSRQATA
ncbi:hypothetical protein ACG7TL_002913 [Trametes sanguinea]